MLIKKKISFTHKLLTMLLILAPTLANYQSSMFFWGEVEIPESLRS